jgi:hypothetical protein
MMMIQSVSEALLLVSPPLKKTSYMPKEIRFRVDRRVLSVNAMSKCDVTCYVTSLNGQQYHDSEITDGIDIIHDELNKRRLCTMDPKN